MAVCAGTICVSECVFGKGVFVDSISRKSPVSSKFDTTKSPDIPSSTPIPKLPTNSNGVAISGYDSIEWYSVYVGAVTESNHQLALQAIAAAEAALFRRMKTLYYSSEQSSERAAIEEAWSSLQSVKSKWTSQSVDGPPLAA